MFLSTYKCSLLNVIHTYSPADLKFHLARDIFTTSFRDPQAKQGPQHFSLCGGDVKVDDPPQATTPPAATPHHPSPLPSSSSWIVVA